MCGWAGALETYFILHLCSRLNEKVNLWLPFPVKCQSVELVVFQLWFLTATPTPEWNITDESREHFSWWKHYKPLKKPHKPLQPLHNLWWALQLIVNGFHYILWPWFIMVAIRHRWLTVVNISSRLQTEKTTLSAITVLHNPSHFPLSALWYFE